MRNRDYWTRPIQTGGRSTWDYGNTRLVSDGKVYPRELGWKIGAVVVAVFIVLGANAAWANAGHLAVTALSSLRDGARAGLHPDGLQSTFAKEASREG